MIGAFILQIILIFMNAIFASAEIAVLSVNEARLEKLMEEGNKKASKLFKLTRNPSKFLSTIQVAITLAALLGSAYAADSFAMPLVTFILGLGVTIAEGTLHSIVVFLITITLSYFSIVLGELIPKRLAMKHSEKIALGLAGLLSFVSVCFAPFVWVLTKSTNAILRLMKIDPDEQNDAITEEEILMMLDSGSAHGTIDSLENEVIQNVFEFDDFSLSEICTHRRDTVFLYRDSDFEEWTHIIKETGHSFYPVCGEDADDIIAVLNIKKFFMLEVDSIEKALKVASDKPYFVPSNTKADILFEGMKKERTYFAVVVDEYGGTNGIITLHDLIELLLGDLYDKDDKINQDIRKLSDNKWEIAGAAMLEEVEEQLDIKFEAEDCDTFGGYIFGILGSIPDDGSEFELETERLHIKVKKVEDHRIEKTTVKLKEFPKEDED